ncbi:MAG: hypothetical protein ABL927_12545 [Bdellovibrionales bacterium]
MTPRLSSSKKWTAIPPELCDQIKEVFAENFSNLAKIGNIIVEGRIYTEEMVLRVGFLEKGRLMQANFEVSIDFNSAKQNALKFIHFMVDCAASMVQEFESAGMDADMSIEEGSESLPREWSSIKFEKQVAFVKFTTENSELEAAANKLLGIAKDDLVIEEPEIDLDDEDLIADLDDEDGLLGETGEGMDEDLESLGADDADKTNETGEADVADEINEITETASKNKKEKPTPAKKILH